MKCPEVLRVIALEGPEDQLVSVEQAVAIPLVVACIRAMRIQINGHRNDKRAFHRRIWALIGRLVLEFLF